MSKRIFRARVGYARLPSTVDPTQASYTQDIRKQMENIEKALSDVIEQIQEASPEIVLEALRPTFEKSQMYCPKDSGALKASGYLEAKQTASGVQVEMGYGRRGVPNYAVYVHERSDFHHQAPTRAKFLQAAIEEDIEAIEQRIQEGYRSLIT